MTEIKKISTLSTLPGIRRDGTVLDGNYYTDGQWVRFQRGRPKKIGGYRMITNQLRGPVRDALVWSRASMNAIYSFSEHGIEMVLVDADGVGNSIIDRTPSGWADNTLAVWTTATQYDDAGGSSGTIVLAHCNSSLSNIDDTTASKPYFGLATGDAAFTSLSSAPSISGGVFSAAPYTFVHGSDGYLAWSDANLPQTWSGGDSGYDRITGAKIVRGMPLRSGSGPAALLWSLDSVLRMDWIGGASIFRFAHLSTQTSVLSQKSVIEYDGVYFWLGVDRFLVCDGSSVRELPNQMNINWFFDNLNFAQRQKVWAMKVPRFGEIWWFYPHGNEEECNRAIIYNVRENIWYDTARYRSAGFYSQVFHYPVMMEGEDSFSAQRLTLSSVTGTFRTGDALTTSTSSSATVARASGTTVYTELLAGPKIVVGDIITNTSAYEQALSITMTSGVLRVGDTIISSTGAHGSVLTWAAPNATVRIINGTAFTASTTMYAVNSSSTGNITSVDAAFTGGATVSTADPLFDAYVHEVGTDAVHGDLAEPVESYFITADFGFPTGGIQGSQPEGLNRWTRLVRVEPDFLQTGEVCLQVIGKEFANAPELVSLGYNFTGETQRIDLREQRREIKLKFTSNVAGGHYEMGRVLLHLEPGDVRS